ncbi:protein of unknown function [Candidatus Nitrosotalea okcheonensis]|uniref:Uncharacterized protein n=1 Tax=Candidatus Nitrosotalea okcheonensis TaxID=1903276 RepID=A0A2H1FE02_9ARCH|nr:protein of unknown function [Candidatus Nitrosotalea okcheonensis]
MSHIARDTLHNVIAPDMPTSSMFHIDSIMTQMFWGRYRVSNDTLLPGPAPKTMTVFHADTFKANYREIEIL